MLLLDGFRICPILPDFVFICPILFHLLGCPFLFYFCLFDYCDDLGHYFWMSPLHVAFSLFFLTVLIVPTTLVQIGSYATFCNVARCFPLPVGHILWGAFW